MFNPSIEKDDLIESIQALYLKNLITSSDGNASVRTQNSSDNIWITPSRVPKNSLSAKQLIKLDLSGNVISTTRDHPSSEIHLHLEIFKKFSEINAVIHTHPPKASVLMLAELPFMPITTIAAYIGEIPRIPFFMPGSIELGKAVADAMVKNQYAVLMQNHGMVTAGNSIKKAVELSFAIERIAELIVGSYALGKEPAIISDEMVAIIKTENKYQI